MRTEEDSMSPDGSDEVVEWVLEALGGATTRRTPFTLGYLGTVGVGGRPRVRAIILRRFDREEWRLMFATNALSPKIAEIRREPQVALTLNDDERAVQLRIEGRASVVEEQAERKRAWETFGPGSRHLYDSAAVPAAPLREGQDAGAYDEAAAFGRFAWVGIGLEQLDWLDLSGAEHRRWQLSREGDAWSGHRVVP